MGSCPSERSMSLLEAIAAIAAAAGVLSAFLSWSDLRLGGGLDFGTPSAVDFTSHYLSMNGYGMFFPIAACAVLALSIAPMAVRRRSEELSTAVSLVILLLDLASVLLCYCFLSWNTGWLAYTVVMWDRMMPGAWLFIAALAATILSNMAILVACHRLHGYHGFSRRTWAAAILVLAVAVMAAGGWYAYTQDDGKAPHMDDDYEISSLCLDAGGTEYPDGSGIEVSDVSELAVIRDAMVMLRSPDGSKVPVEGYAVEDGLPDNLEPGGVYTYTVRYGGLESTVYAFSEDDSMVTDTDIPYTVSEGSGGTLYTFTMSSDGTLSLSGRLVGGIIVETRGHSMVLRLDSFELIGCAGAPIEIYKGSVSVELTGDSSIIDRSFRTGSLESFAVHCGGDLAVSGSGSLSVYSALHGGIRCLGSFSLSGSSLTVDSMEDAVRAKGAVSLSSGTLDAVSRHGDGIRGGSVAAGSDSPMILTVMAADDGIRGKDGVSLSGDSLTATVRTDRYSEHTIGIPGLLEPDHYDRNATKGHSCKGIRSSGDISISGGSYSISSRDDGIHAGGSVTIGSGTMVIVSGDDGIHADGDIEVSDVDIGISSYEGIEGDLITLNGGAYRIRTEDDGINSSGMDSGGIVINGGSFDIVAFGDGLDSNLERRARGVVINGGDMLIHVPGGQAGIDTEQGYTFNGGHVLMVCIPSIASMQSTYCSDASQFSYACMAPGTGSLTVSGDGSSATMKVDEARSCLLVALGFGDEAVFSVSYDAPAASVRGHN